MIRWQDKDPATVERAVQALVRRLYPEASSIDGSGGDDGQDLIWRSPDGLVIFEVKSYTERLKNNQKAKIAGSLRRASAHGPVRWCLIVPRNHTPAELSWFDGLRDKDPNIELEWRGRDYLDENFAAHEDLTRLVEGEDYALLQRARELSMEQAALAGGIPDLLERYQKLQSRSLELSPHWRIDITTRPAGIDIVFGERYPGAAAADPIRFNPVFEFPADDADAEAIATDLHELLDYGGDITVPDRYIKSFDIEASNETRKLWGPLGPDSTPGKMRISSIENNEGLPLLCKLVLLAAGDTLKREVNISLTRRVAGQRGVTLTGSDASNVLQVKLRMNFRSDEGAAGRLDLSHQSFVGRLPHDVNPALQLLRHVDSGDRLELRLGPLRAGFSELDAKVLEYLHPFADLTETLTRLQDLTGQLIPIPSRFDSHDLTDLDSAVQALNGERAPLRFNQLTATIRAGQGHAFLRPLASQGYEGQIYATYEDLKVTFSDQAVDLGPMAVWGPKMRLANVAEIEDAAPGEEPIARFVCFDDGRLYLMRPTPTNPSRDS